MRATIQRAPAALASAGLAARLCGQRPAGFEGCLKPHQTVQMHCGSNGRSHTCDATSQKRGLDSKVKQSNTLSRLAQPRRMSYAGFTSVKLPLDTEKEWG